MEMQDVKSDWIKAVGYDAERRELHVTMKNGGAYTHHDVDLPSAMSFINADSKGRHYNQHIRPNFPKITRAIS